MLSETNNFKTLKSKMLSFSKESWIKNLIMKLKNSNKSGKNKNKLSKILQITPL